MKTSGETSARLRWARLRFSIIGPLLSAPPEPGNLAKQIALLATRDWRHPATGEPMQISSKTIERWYYLARAENDPIRALERKVPSHAGIHWSLSEATKEAIRLLRKEHPRWSAQLVYDNLCALGHEQASLSDLPGYATVCRYMKHNGLGKARKPRRHEEAEGFVPRERRLFEVRHVHGLWHCDFHDCKRRVIAADGTWQDVVLFVVMDDHSRLCCHAQWYISPGNTENFVHGLSQAFQRRSLPRALLSDNGGPMLAAETEEGLLRLGVEHHTTLPRTPEQNGKQEVFFSQVEGRLVPMLEGESELTLELLNRATQAWVEHEYQLHFHSETKQSPWDRFRSDPSVGRACPSSDELRRLFRTELTRQQRRSDGTITVEGVRFEIPSIYRTIVRPTVRVARWDLSTIDLVDPRTGTHLTALYPVDLVKNAERRRRAIRDPGEVETHISRPTSTGIAPLLRQLMAKYAADGMPPAYVPYDSTNHEPNNEETPEE